MDNLHQTIAEQAGKQIYRTLHEGKGLLIHSMPGRIRFRVPDALHLGDSGQALDCLRTIPGIRELRLNLACRSLRISYDPQVVSSERVFGELFLLSQSVISKYTQQNGSEHQNEAHHSSQMHKSNRQEKELSEKSSKQTDDEGEKERVKIIHSLPDRLRLRLRVSKIDGSRLAAYLFELDGINEAHWSPYCQSLTIRFDPTVHNRKSICRLIQQTELSELSEVVPASPKNAESLPEDAPRRSMFLSASSFLLLPILPRRLCYWLLLTAAAPVMRRGAHSLFRCGKLNVDVLDASALVVLFRRRHYGSAAMMIWLIALGDLIRDITVQKSQRAIESIFDGVCQTAWVDQDGQVLNVPLEDIKHGDQVLAYPGELIPVDGTVIDGVAAVDQKMLTGESMPVERTVGVKVYAGTVLREGRLRISAEHIGKETAAGRILEMILSAPADETRIQQYAEQFADRFVPWSFAAAGLLVFLRRPQAAAALLIADFGTGIRVAAPTSVLASMAKAARSGILIKGGRQLELLAKVDAVVFDKTGTLTQGNPSIGKIFNYDAAYTEERVLQLAASVEKRLTHPIADAICQAAVAGEITLLQRRNCKYSIGNGVEAIVEGSEVLFGSRRYLNSHGVDTSVADADFRAVEATGAGLLLLAIDGRAVGGISYADPVRSESARVIQSLKAQGIRYLTLVTGDSKTVAQGVAARLGIKEFVAEALPDDKAAIVRRLQKEGYTVAVVGDGINDSPALAVADVGIAMHGGADVARETAGVALLEPNLRKIPLTFTIAREAIENIAHEWDINLKANSSAMLLALLGLIGPVSTTLISNGAAVAATLSALRPLAESELTT